MHIAELDSKNTQNSQLKDNKSDIQDPSIVLLTNFQEKLLPSCIFKNRNTKMIDLWRYTISQEINSHPAELDIRNSISKFYLSQLIFQILKHINS